MGKSEPVQPEVDVDGPHVTEAGLDRPPNMVTNCMHHGWRKAVPSECPECQLESSRWIVKRAFDAGLQIGKGNPAHYPFHMVKNSDEFWTAFKQYMADQELAHQRAELEEV